MVAVTGTVATAAGIFAAMLARQTAWFQFYDDFHCLAANLTAAALGWISVRQAGGRDQSARIWFAIGFSASALASSVHGLQIWRAVSHFSSASGAFFLLFGPCALAGLLCAILQETQPGQRWPVWLDALAGALVAAGVALVAYLPSAGELSAFQAMAVLVFPMFTLSAAAAGLALIIHVRPRLHASSVLFLGSLVAVGLIWVEWNRRSLSGDRLDPAWTSILFSICVLGLGIGAAQWRIWRSSNELYRRLAGVAVDFMPMGAIACAILAILFSLANDDLSGAARATVVLAGSGVALVSVLRQSLLLVEFRRAQRPAEEARITAAAANPFGSRLVRHGYWAYDVSSGGGTWSNEAREIYGVADDVQPTFEDFIDCLDPRDRERVRGSFNAAISGRQTSYAAEFRVRHPRLGERSILDRGWIERDPGGRALRIHGLALDVTELRSMEADLAQSRDRLELALAGSGASVWEWNQRASDPIEAGFPSNAPASRPGEPQSFDLAFPDTVHADDRQFAMASLSKMLSGDAVKCEAELRVRGRNGELRWILCRGRVTGRDESGTVTRISGVKLDITDRRRMEEALQESKARYEIAERIARLSHWICVPNPDPAVDSPLISFSRTAATILAIAEADLAMPASVYRDKFLHPDDREQVWEQLKNAFAARSNEVEIEYRILNGEGSVRVIHEHCRFEFHADGRMKRGYGTIQDITERKLVEEALRNAQTAAESANRAKTQFLANTSHELRTPLNAIIGFSEIMSSEIFGPIGIPAYRQYSTDIHASGQHLLGIINDLLDLSRIEAGETRLSEEIVEISAVISTAMTLVRARARERRIELASDLPAPAPAVRVDPRLLKQVLINLLSNAIKFTPDGGSVRVGLDDSAAGIDVSVSDTGIGMSRDELNAIAKPFVQIENWLVRKHEGVGLGLAISKSLLELHGGSLEITSRKGHGTVATARLPADRVVRTRDPATAMAHKDAPQPDRLQVTS